MAEMDVFEMDVSAIKSLISSTYLTVKKAHYLALTLQVGTVPKGNGMPSTLKQASILFMLSYGLVSPAYTTYSSIIKEVFTDSFPIMGLHIPSLWTKATTSHCRKFGDRDIIMGSTNPIKKDILTLYTHVGCLCL